MKKNKNGDWVKDLQRKYCLSYPIVLNLNLAPTFGKI